MDIVCCTDNNYIKYCCVMLTSLLENNKEENLKSASNLNGNLNCSKELEHYAS